MAMLYCTNLLVSLINQIVRERFTILCDEFIPTRSKKKKNKKICLLEEVIPKFVLPK
jgi:hypothetical protein